MYIKTRDFCSMIVNWFCVSLWRNVMFNITMISFFHATCCTLTSKLSECNTGVGTWLCILLYTMYFKNGVLVTWLSLEFYVILWKRRYVLNHIDSFTALYVVLIHVNCQSATHVVVNHLMFYKSTKSLILSQTCNITVLWV